MAEKRGYTSEVIGRSEEGRPLHVFHAGDAAGPWRVLILAGQHGDEGESRAAVEHFFKDYRAPQGTPPVCLAVMPDLNPDGASKNSRTNAHGIDLNRDHLLLAAAETQALHQYVRTWRPHLILDVHTYPPRRKRLLLHNLVYCHDVFLDVPTNPGVRHANFPAESAGALESILGQVNAQGYRAGRYVLATASGMVRHSTMDVTDARNGLALRYNVPTFLIEGRKHLKADGPAGRARLQAALQAAIGIVLRESAKCLEYMSAPYSTLEEEAWVAIRARHQRGVEPCIQPFQDSSTGTVRRAEMPGVYCPTIKITKRIRLPAAYAVPQSHDAVIEVLRRHGFSNQPALPGLKELRELTDYMLFPITPDGGNALAVYLEAESKYGLHRYAEMNLTPRRNFNYPILRILNSD